MRNFPAQQRNSTAQQRNSFNLQSQCNVLSPKKAASSSSSDDKPDWMKRLSQKSKTEGGYRGKNIDFDMFPSMNESSSSEITYLEGEDDLAASYFRTS